MGNNKKYSDTKVGITSYRNIDASVDLQYHLAHPSSIEIIKKSLINDVNFQESIVSTVLRSLKIISIFGGVVLFFSTLGMVIGAWLMSDYPAYGNKILEIAENKITKS